MKKSDTVSKLLIMEEESSFFETPISTPAKTAETPGSTGKEGESPAKEDSPVKTKATLEELQFELKGVLEAIEDLLSGDEEGEGYDTELARLESRSIRLTKLVEVRKRLSLSTEDEETAKTATKSSKVGMKRAIVPNNMPKFRQNGPYEEPTEFLEAFAKVMAAHEIPQGKYANLLMLYLDSVDS